MTTHLIGMLLGTEEDWPAAFEHLMSRLNLRIEHKGDVHTFATERVTHEPFNLQYRPRHALVIDRLAWWYVLPREWLKKVALMDDVYLLNNPFTFQSMEKHAAYCVMMRLGLKIPETWMVPHKQPPPNPRFPRTAQKYNQAFRLEDIAAEIGYPLYMKPFDGGQWVGVSRVANDEELHRAYDESGERLMHLQAAIDDYDVFARSLSIGAETMVMRFDPTRPLHDRYQIDHGFLTAKAGDEAVTIGRLVNAFFRWEFNSCETLIRGEDVIPIDYANATPDVALTSLHYYFPWAISALVKWSVFCLVTGRVMALDQNMRRFFAVADVGGLDYDERLREYRRLADEYFQVDEYHEFCDLHLSHVDEVMLEYVDSPDFDRVLVDTVASTFPSHEHDQFIAHYRGILSAWVGDRSTPPTP